MKEVEDEAYFYRRHRGPQWKIDAADDELERTQFERDYKDELNLSYLFSAMFGKEG